MRKKPFAKQMSGIRMFVELRECESTKQFVGFQKKESQMLHACMESNLTLRPAKHEEEAICDKSVVNI